MILILTYIKIKEFNEEHKLNIICIQELFPGGIDIDYSLMRNRCIFLARKYFNNVNFMIMVDSEWYMNGLFQLLNYLKSEIDTDNIYYYIYLKNNSFLYSSIRLFRACDEIKYVGDIHEVIENDQEKTKYTHI